MAAFALGTVAVAAVLYRCLTPSEDISGAFSAIPSALSAPPEKCVGGEALLRSLDITATQINKPGLMGYTPLHDVAMKGDVEAVSTLLCLGANPEHRNKLGGTHDDEGNALNLDTFCGVKARELIKKGSIIAEYVGQMFSLDEERYGEDADYQWGLWPRVDSKWFRSEGAMINHAFPNTEVSCPYANAKMGLDGLLYRRFIVAANDIQPGDEIAIDYGINYP